MIDKTSSPINVGDLVRLVELQMDAFGHLDSNEIADIRSMLGETFPVEKVTTTGFLTVTKYFDRGAGKWETHTLSLHQRQFELVG